MALIRPEDEVARQAALAAREAKRKLNELNNLETADRSFLVATLVQRFRDAYGNGDLEPHAYQFMHCGKALSDEKLIALREDLKDRLTEQVDDADKFKVYVDRQSHDYGVFVELIAKKAKEQ